MSSVTFAIEFLRENSSNEYSALEIAEELARRHKQWAEKKHNSSLRAKKYGDSIERIIQNEISSSKDRLRKAGIHWTEDWPARFYFPDMPPIFEPDKMHEKRIPARKSGSKSTDSVPRSRNNPIKEHDLYRPLQRWLATLPRKVHAMRIDEKKASRKSPYPKANHWRFPDLVGLEPLSDNWKSETSKFAGHIGASKMRLWSFEVKNPITNSNVRECYFQAVSNSSWAHVGYLVVQVHTKDAEEEIRILNEVHGIGLIILEKDLSRGQILIPARPRGDLDWNAINKLCEVSDEFQEFMKDVSGFITNDKVPKFPSAGK